jgi:hypothetical protein
MPIDLGIGQEQAQAESKPKPVPVATYEFVVAEIREVTTQAGRPGWNWFLRVVNHPDQHDRIVFYRTYFPWVDPMDGQVKKDDLWKLTNIIDGTNSWDLWSSSGQLADKESFYGRTGFMKVTQQARKDDPETIDNVANIVVKKKK